MPQVCRTCLQEITDSKFIALTDNTESLQIRTLLTTCIPEMVIDRVTHPILCSTCVTSLYSAYDFKIRCLLTEECIQNCVNTMHLDDRNFTLEQMYSKMKQSNLLNLNNVPHSPNALVDDLSCLLDGALQNELEVVDMQNESQDSIMSDDMLEIKDNIIKEEYLSSLDDELENDLYEDEHSDLTCQSRKEEKLKLNLPSYETVKGTVKNEQELAIARWNSCSQKRQSIEIANVTTLIVESNIGNIGNEQPDNTVNALCANKEIVSKIDEPIIDEACAEKDKQMQIDDVVDIQGCSPNYVTTTKLPLLAGTDDNKLWDEDSSIESSESDYVPSSESSDDESGLRGQESNTSKQLNTTGKEAMKSNITDTTINNNEHCITIISANKDQLTGKRIRDKRHSCYFCHRTLKHLARHLQKVHANETEVRKLLALSKKSKIRKAGFGNLLRIGDYYHNCEVLIKKEGELILVRRPSEQEKLFLNYSDYGPCPDCLGFLLKKHLWHHLKFGCTAKKTTDGDGNIMHRKPISESMALIAHTFDSAVSNDFVINILSKLKDDPISLVCCQDNLIMKFGELQYERYRTNRCELTRQSLRQLSRLVLELRKLDSTKSWLSQWLTPECFGMLVTATKNLCSVQYEYADRPQFSVPSLAVKLGYNLRKCLAIERGRSLRRGELERNVNLNLLMNAINSEWNYKIFSNGMQYNGDTNTNEFHEEKLKEISICDLLRLDNEEKNVEESDSEESMEIVENEKNNIETRTVAKSATMAKLTGITSTTSVQPDSGIKATTSIKSKITVRTSRQRMNITGRASTTKRPWRSEETEAVVSFFRSSIKVLKVPGKEKCTECIEFHGDLLSSRAWKDIKYHVKNYLTKIKRKDFSSHV